MYIEEEDRFEPIYNIGETVELTNMDELDQIREMLPNRNNKFEISEFDENDGMYLLVVDEDYHTWWVNEEDIRLYAPHIDFSTFVLSGGKEI